MREKVLPPHGAWIIVATFCQATLSFHAHPSGARCSHPLDIYLLVCSKDYTNDHIIVSLAYVLLINCLWRVLFAMAWLCRSAELWLRTLTILDFSAYTNTNSCTSLFS